MKTKLYGLELPSGYSSEMKLNDYGEIEYDDREDLIYEKNDITDGAAQHFIIEIALTEEELLTVNQLINDRNNK